MYLFPGSSSIFLCGPLAGGPADSRDKESQSTIPISEKDADTRVELTVQGNSI